MSDHIWVQENLAAYVMGGLEPEERVQFEQHLAICSDCRQALDDARATDQHLGELFVSQRPVPALEERTIRSLRQAEVRSKAIVARRWRGLLVAASVAFVAMTGAIATSMIEGADLTAPGQASNNLKELGYSLHGSVRMARPEKDEKSLRDDVDNGRRAQSEGGERSHFGAMKPPDDSIYNDLSTRAETLRLQRESDLRSADPLKLNDMDPAAIDPSVALSYNVDRKAGVSVPGVVDHKAPVGVLNGDKFSPPTNLPAPARGFGYGLGGTLPGTHNGRPSSLKDKAFSPDGRSTATNGTTGLQLWNRSQPMEYFKLNALFKDLEPGKAKLDDLRDLPDGERKKEGGKLTAPLGEHSAKGGDVLAQKGESKLPEFGLLKQHPVPPSSRKIIRTGEIEFEVESFDSATAAIIQLVGKTKGFVATINSDKLANGKVRGSVVVRMPPDQLDQFVLDLRKELTKGGELKSQRIGSQDVTKQYTDLESRLRAARTMEERLLKIIKDGKGEIKDLIVAEKELGVWRTRIEEMEGELRYYAHQVSLSTLTIGLTEKEIRVAASVTERERVQAGIEVDDVDEALRKALQAIAEFKGRVTKSEMKQHSAGQFTALLHFEVKYEDAGPMRDRLKQIGDMVRLEIDRVQEAEGGTLPKDGKLIRGETQFKISLYNLANIAPRETVTLKLVATDVPAAFRALRENLSKLRGRVINAGLVETDRQNITAQIDFDIRRTDEGAALTALTAAGEVLSRQVVRNPDAENNTDKKVLFKVELVNAINITPRETITLGVEVTEVETTMTALAAQVKDAGGRVLQSQLGLERSGRVTGHFVADVPLPAASGLVERFKATGQVRIQQVARNPQAPDGKLAIVRIDLTLSNAELLVPRDEGVGSQLRQGVSTSLQGLALSLRVLVIGLLFVLPWVLLIAAVVWLVRRWFWNSPNVEVAAGEEKS